MKRVIRLTESDLTRIVKRVIKEQASVVGAPGTPLPSDDTMTPEEQKDNQLLATTINNMGLPVDTETIDEIDSCSADEDVDPKIRPFFDAIKQKIEAIPDVNTLYAELRNVLSIKKRMKRGQMSEQAAAAGLAIAGVAIPGWAIAAVAALVVILIIKTIINRTKGNKSYRKKKRHLKKGCYSKKRRKGIHSWMGY